MGSQGPVGVSPWVGGGRLGGWWGQVGVLVGGSGGGLGDIKEKAKMEGWAVDLCKKGRQTREKWGLSRFLLSNVPFLGGGGPKITDCNRHWAMNLVVIT